MPSFILLRAKLHTVLILVTTRCHFICVRISGSLSRSTTWKRRTVGCFLVLPFLDLASFFTRDSILLRPSVPCRWLLLLSRNVPGWLSWLALR
jgi:hypothetical protein